MTGAAIAEVASRLIEAPVAIDNVGAPIPGRLKRQSSATLCGPPRPLAWISTERK
jgi:hypothetical protein